MKSICKFPLFPKCFTLPTHPHNLRAPRGFVCLPLCVRACPRQNSFTSLAP